MKITLENYIEIFIDYFEGRLTASETLELMEFISSYPQLQKEFDQMQTVFLQPLEADKINFIHLLKDVNQRNEINVENFEEICIAELEGDLSNTFLRAQLYQWINNSEENGKTFALYKQTRTRPDEKIVFPNKKLLKKREKSLTLLWTYRSIAVAASIMLLFGLVKWWMIQLDKLPVRSTDLVVVGEQMNHSPSSLSSLDKKQQNTDKYRNVLLGKKTVRNFESASGSDSIRKVLQQSAQQLPINELSPKTAMVETFIPYRDFIIIDEKIFYRNINNQIDDKTYLTVGEWMNEQLKKWKDAVLKLPAEYSLARVSESSLQQMTLFSKNHVIFRQNTDTLYGRKQVEVNLGWVEFYFSYSAK